MAQKSTVSGKITDGATGAPLQGVSILAKPSGGGTVTNAEGFYTISVDEKDVLYISSVGYDGLQVKVAGRQTIDAALTPAVTDLSQIVVVGTRGAGRVRTETPVPVDVISVNSAGQTTAKTDLTSILNMAAPSFNYNKQSGSDGADAIDLATLRGLGPDQTLVLINGKRRHQTAFVSLFGTRGRGNSGTDLNAIPEAAIDRVEILRDGASAQYGSDAIAGVINIILKKNVSQLSLNTGWAGYYDHKYNSLKSPNPSEYVTSHKVDGNTGKIGVNYGVPVGKRGGFMNLSGNFLAQGKTFRQVPDTAVTKNSEALPVNTGRRAFGDASLLSGGVMVNSELPLANRKTVFYFFGGYNYKSSEAYAYSRNFSGRPERFPTTASGSLIFVPDIMHYSGPGSTGDVYYNPLINVHITDASLAAGWRGAFANGWDWDISNTIGRNNFHFFGDKTFNAGLGTSQTHFDDGGFSFIQNTTNADISRHYNSIASGFTLSLGAEYRFEEYRIYKGEEASYKNYNAAKATGSQGFPGFQPADEVSAHRHNGGLYVDAELDVTNKWLVGGAVRGEQYSDFGSLATFKFDTRYKLTRTFNLRGSFSTGFRAPSLQQINFSNTFTNVQGGKLFEVKIAPNTSAITKAAGIPSLTQEKSVNASTGFSWKAGRSFTVTLDGYMVKIRNRVVLSGQFDESVTALASTLHSLNVAQAQFYANAVNTTNFGLDMVVNYNKTWGAKSFKGLFAGNLQHMKIDKINVPAALNDTYEHRQAFFSDREQKYVLASARPAKLNLNLEYGVKKLSFGTHFTYYGKIEILGYGYAILPPQVELDKTGAKVLEQFNYNGKLVSDVYAIYKL